MRRLLRIHQTFKYKKLTQKKKLLQKNIKYLITKTE